MTLFPHLSKLEAMTHFQTIVDAGCRVRNSRRIFFQTFVLISTIYLYDVVISLCLYDTGVSLGLYDTDLSEGLYDLSFLSMSLWRRFKQFRRDLTKWWRDNYDEFGEKNWQSRHLYFVTLTWGKTWRDPDRYEGIN